MKLGRRVFSASLLVAVSVLTLVTAPGPCTAADAYFNADLLVQPEWLVTHGGTPGLIVVDFGRGRDEYDDGHVPGAVFVDMARITTNVGGVPMMLAHVERVASVLRGVGINDASTVVVYDDAGGLRASRLFWAVEYLGHEDVRMLDGGWGGWLAAGGEESQESPSYSRGDFTPQVRHEVLATRDWILESMGDAGTVVLDVRSEDEYSGADARAEMGGHIPGAVNVDWVGALTEANGRRVLPPGELRALYEQAGVTSDREVVTYCQGGVCAAHTYFVLRLLGYSAVRVYDGSWADWGNDPELPVVEGAAPSSPR